MDYIKDFSISSFTLKLKDSRTSEAFRFYASKKEALMFLEGEMFLLLAENWLNSAGYSCDLVLRDEIKGFKAFIEKLWLKIMKKRILDFDVETYMEEMYGENWVKDWRDFL